MRSVLAALVLVSAAAGGAMAPLSMPLQVATADAIFVGKVTAAPGGPMASGVAGDARKMTLAPVTVSASFLGGAGKNVEVGAFTPAYRGSPPALVKGVEYLFLVKRHPARKNTYYAASIYEVHQLGGSTKGLVDEAKRLAALLADPMKTLAGKDRASAAAMLVLRYKTAGGAGAKTEAVPAEECKLLLTALAEADWKGGDWMTSPRQAFARLNLTAADGWAMPADAAAFDTAAKKWLKENAGKYKMTRHVGRAAGTSAEP